MRRNQAERTELVVERTAIESVGEQNAGVLNAGIEFSNRENHSITVSRFDQDIRRHGCAPKLLALRHAGQFQQVRQGNALIDFHLVFVRIGDFERLVRHGAQLRKRKRLRLCDITRDGERDGGRSSLGGDEAGNEDASGKQPVEEAAQEKPL